MSAQREKECLAVSTSATFSLPSSGAKLFAAPCQQNMSDRRDASGLPRAERVAGARQVIDSLERRGVINH